MRDLRFKEIEHKFVVDDTFDLDHFRAVLAARHPVRTGTIRVRDRYYLTEGGGARRFLIRHRYDPELHQLTLKGLEDDTEVRTEVNLDLGHRAGGQEGQVDAFVDCLGVLWRGTVQKDVEVWYFADCEVVHYRASSPSRSVRCVEFEATVKGSLPSALETLERFEHATGFEGAVRSHLSLPQMLFPELVDMLSGH